jgi:hypothetical protein
MALTTLTNGMAASSFRAALNSMFAWLYAWWNGYYLATDHGLVADGTTDNAAALNTLLGTIASAGENATIYFADGVYLFSGALQDGSRRNAQILLPSVEIDDTQYTIRFLGAHPIACSPSGYETTPRPKGAVLKSDLASGSGTLPSFIGGKGPVSGPNNETTYFHLEMENLIIEVPANPSISALNFTSIGNLHLNNVIIMAGETMSVIDQVEPTTTTSYGLILPRDSSGILQSIGHVNIFNFYTGAKVGELSHIERHWRLELLLRAGVRL